MFKDNLLRNKKYVVIDTLENNKDYNSIYNEMTNIPSFDKEEFDDLAILELNSLKKSNIFKRKLSIQLYQYKFYNEILFWVLPKGKQFIIAKFDINDMFFFQDLFVWFMISLYMKKSIVNKIMHELGLGRKIDYDKGIL